MAFIFSTQLNTTPRREKICDWAGPKKKIGKFVKKKKKKKKKGGEA